MKKIISIIILCLAVLAFSWLYYNEYNERLIQQGRAENFEQLYVELLTAEQQEVIDTVYYYDTLTTTKINVIDSVKINDSIILDTIDNMYVRVYLDSMVKNDFSVTVRSFVQGKLLKNTWGLNRYEITKTINKVVYKTKTIEVPENKWKFYGMAGYRLKQPSIGILALSKGRLGFGYKNYFGDTHEFLILYRL